MADEPQGGDPLSFYTSGQKFAPQAATLNAWQQAARLIRDGGFGTSGQMALGGLAGVLVKNYTNENRARGDVMALSGSVFQVSDHPHAVRQPPLLIATEPSTDYEASAILLEPIPANKCGYAAIWGVAWTKVNFQKEGDLYAYTQKESYVLKSSAICGNCRVLYPFTETGETDALVLVGLEPSFFGPAKLSAAFASTDTSGKVKPEPNINEEITAKPWGELGSLDLGDKVVLFRHQTSADWYFYPIDNGSEQQYVLTNVSLGTSAVEFKKRGLIGRWTDDEEDGPTLATTDCPE